MAASQTLTTSDASFFLALVYLLASLFAARKLYVIRLVSRSWETTTYFVGSILFACSVRCLVFATLCALSLLDVGLTSGGTDASGNSDQRASVHAIFYLKTVRVLFNLGDFIVVSCYLLLVVVWVETFQQSRRHWYSQDKSRRNWMILYLVFNFVLYVSQILMYLLYFFLDQTSVDSNFLYLVYYGLSAIDMGVPIFLTVMYLYYNCAYAGFPFKSVADRDTWSKMSRLTMVWSIGRAIWGIFSVVSVRFSWLEPSATTRASPTYSMVLVGVFVVIELVPFMLALTSDLLTLLARNAGYLALHSRVVEADGSGSSHDLLGRKDTGHGLALGPGRGMVPNVSWMSDGGASPYPSSPGGAESPLPRGRGR